MNTGNVDELDKLISPDYIEVLYKTGQSKGIPGAKRYVLGVRETYPDLHLAIERQIAESDWVVTQNTARGNHV